MNTNSRGGIRSVIRDGHGPIALVAAALATVTAPGAASAATLTWNGVTGDWTIGSNWTPGGPPGSGDVAVVNAGIATLNSSSTIQGLT
ncbi:MAG: hypothetical protein IT484_10535 [Gammaproteobacteria bacterium]|nr:hypothetical protein [Gammaproteobacteria bacterium]